MSATDVKAGTLSARRQRWLDALRSGRYEQGVQNLFYRSSNRPGRHCCLGVGLSVCGFPPILAAEAGFGSYNDSAGYDRVHEALGLSRRVSTRLIAMNDGVAESFLPEHRRHTDAKRSFAFIARFLEIVWALEARQ